MTTAKYDRVVARRITDDDDLQRAFHIRRLVFLLEQKVPPEEEFDADDKTAVHVLAFAGSEPVATGRLIFSDDHARIGRMAVLKEYRRQGVGRAVLEELMRIARAERVGRLVLHAQVHAIAFYESMGFCAVGSVFDEAGIPHRAMQREL